MDDRDTLGALISAPLLPLDAGHRSARYADEIAAARALHDRDPDDYWAWVAEQHRWLAPYDTVRTGELGDFRYFDGGRINVADNCVDRWAESTPDRHAVVWEGEPGDSRTLTYAELADEVSRLGAGLTALGVEKGDVVAIYMPNLVEAFTAIHACNRIGAIYTVLFSGFGRDAVASRLAAARAKVVVVADAIYRRGRPVTLLETLRAARPDTPTLQHTVVVDRTGDGVPLTEGETSYRELVDAHPEGSEVVGLDANEPAFLIFTSGTESRPKGVVHSVGGFLLGTWANAHWQAALTDDDVYWVAADVGWLTFPIQAVIGGLANGATIACYEGALDTPGPSRFYDICEKHGVTKVLCAPTVLRMLRKFGDDLVREHPLPDLELITVQGEPLDGETFTWATTTLGVPVVNAYGQTETGSTWTYPVAGVDDLKAGSAGTTLPGHACEVVDDEGHPVPAGVKGNLVMTRPFPTLARTVWDDHDRYLSTYFSRFPGKYATNDEAVVDHDGHLWVLGRADDVINVAAHRLSTMEIEAVVGSHPRVMEAAVVGVPDETKGTVPVAFVTVSAGSADGVPDEVKKLVGDTIGGIARPDRVIVTAAMPKTRTGKIMRRLMREVLLHGEARSDTSALEDPSSLDVVAAAVRTA
ncbi:AMP-binding protein [Actinomycetospora sp. TBRC 11914]|uniref:AMP-binding protein n=1 Tax=Actinomycetospora sp. TBRC 11914 TaxID=2729387 RepID=UPI00145E36AD|nr:AMP-binding protein [Actinomycetospora sp. TBRC 11914]NMO92923.1 acetate--CoA ligase [Actinomycetospora sp. TBRC 11914]